jgi:hypothetical protein
LDVGDSNLSILARADELIAASESTIWLGNNSSIRSA